MISGHFGKQQHPVYSQVTMDNKGIYLQTTAGTKARAVYKGEVTSCFMVGGTYAVIIQHGNYRTVYSNLSKLSVKQGDKVETKQAIGTIFTDPEQDQKTELYFQIYKDRNILNPELWIAKIKTFTIWAFIICSFILSGCKTEQLGGLESAERDMVGEQRKEAGRCTVTSTGLQYKIIADPTPPDASARTRPVRSCATTRSNSSTVYQVDAETTYR